MCDARQEWTCKEIAFVLGIAPTKAPQAMGPGLRKIVRLARANLGKTLLLMAREWCRQEDEMQEAARATRAASASQATAPGGPRGARVLP